ncbi:MAG: hypothetical protein WAW73_11675 [Rhodoferax sp.]
MKLHPLNSLAFAMVLGFGLAAHAQTMTKPDLKMARDGVEKDYKAAKVACDSLSGNAKKICVVEAKGNEKSALAEIDARNKPSANADRKVRDAKAEAAYDLAKQKCQDLAGNPKDVCIKEAKAGETAAKADAKLQLKTTEANTDARKDTNKATSTAREKVGEARNEAAADKVDAQYKVEVERCDALAGEAKTSCVAQAKSRGGKS